MHKCKSISPFLEAYVAHDSIGSSSLVESDSSISEFICSAAVLNFVLFSLQIVRGMEVIYSKGLDILF